MWASKNSRVVLERKTGSPEVNIWRDLMHKEGTGPGNVGASRGTPELQEFQPRAVSQQDGASPSWGLLLRQFLNANFPKPGDWEGWSDTMSTMFTGR